MNKENISTRASSPGRVCLGGESLDWMIHGPSVVGAIDLRVYASVQNREDKATDGILLRSAEPLKGEKRVLFSEIDQYNKHTLDFIQASIKVLVDAGLSLQPIQVDTFTKLPTQAGVSSSAAVSLATITALAEHSGMNKQPLEICGLAYQVEKNELQTGAGQMDFYACGLGQLHYLNCLTEPPDPLEEFPIPKDVKLILVDTLTSHNTATYIAQKRERFHSGEPLIMAYIDKALTAVEKIKNLMPEFERNVEEIGHNITLCHSYLRDNVRSSTELLDLCVQTCLGNGAFGGKLTGSGMGGCMFALAKEEDLERIQRALSSLPVKIYCTSFSSDGVRIENS